MKPTLLALAFALTGPAWAAPPAAAPTSAAPTSVAPASAPARDPAQTAAEAIALLEALSTAAQKHAGDCDAVGEAMLGEAETHADTIQVLALLKKGNPAGEVLQARYGERAAKAIRDMLEPLNACHSNPRVRMALKALDAGATE